MSENEPFVFLLYYLAPNYMVDQDHMVFCISVLLENKFIK